MNKLPELDEQRINEAAFKFGAINEYGDQDIANYEAYKSGATSEYFRREEEVRVLTEVVKKIDSFYMNPNIHRLEPSLSLNECPFCIVRQVLLDLEKLRANK